MKQLYGVKNNNFTQVTKIHQYTEILKIAESRYIQTKEYYYTSTRPIRANAGKFVQHLEIKFGGNKYGTQFTNTEGGKVINSLYAQNIYGCGVHTNYIQERVKETQQKGNRIQVQGLHPYKGHESIEGTEPQQPQKFTNKGAPQAINLIKEKNMWKTKSKDVRRWQATQVLHT